MIEDKEMEYVNVPTYIEKTVKKLFKLKNTEKELAMQIKDYMSTHDIPLETPLQLLKYIPKEKFNENTASVNFPKTVAVKIFKNPPTNSLKK